MSHTLNVLKCHIIRVQRKEKWAIHSYMYFLYVPFGSISAKMVVIYLLTTNTFEPNQIITSLLWSVFGLYLSFFFWPLCIQYFVHLLLLGIPFISSNLSTTKQRYHTSTTLNFANDYSWITCGRSVISLCCISLLHPEYVRYPSLIW